jgi:hypothetical protein
VVQKGDYFGDLPVQTYPLFNIIYIIRIYRYPDHEDLAMLNARIDPVVTRARPPPDTTEIDAVGSELRHFAKFIDNCVSEASHGF